MYTTWKQQHLCKLMLMSIICQYLFETELCQHNFLHRLVGSTHTCITLVHVSLCYELGKLMHYFRGQISCNNFVYMFIPSSESITDASSDSSKLFWSGSPSKIVFNTSTADNTLVLLAATTLGLTDSPLYLLKFSLIVKN